VTELFLPGCSWLSDLWHCLTMRDVVFRLVKLLKDVSLKFKP
jgi:hypothetical protein